MKKFLALTLCLALLIPCALAEPSDPDILALSVCLSVYGLPDLKMKDADISHIKSGSIEYAAAWSFDSCRFIATFDILGNVNGARIDGSGDQFLNACAGAIMYLDESNTLADFGFSLYSYLMAQQLDPGEKKTGVFRNGAGYSITKQEASYSFLILK